MNATSDMDFRDSFVRASGGLKHCPTLVLNADYRPLSYYPLSLWPWQDAIKAVYLERVNIVAEYDHVARSQRAVIRIPSVVVLKDYVKPQKKVAFTRFNLFLRDEFRCQYCGSPHDLTFDHVIPPHQPTSEDMRNRGRRFPPNHLHDSWIDFLYWDTELEA